MRRLNAVPEPTAAGRITLLFLLAAFWLPVAHHNNPALFVFCAALATLGIFLPSFIFVALSNPLIPRIRKSPWAGSALDGVNAASLGLMAGVMVDLAKASFPDLLTVLIGLAAAGALFLLRVNPTWLMLAGGAVGLLTGYL